MNTDNQLIPIYPRVKTSVNKFRALKDSSEFTGTTLRIKIRLETRLRVQCQGLWYETVVVRTEEIGYSLDTYEERILESQNRFHSQVYKTQLFYQAELNSTISMDQRSEQLRMCGDDLTISRNNASVSSYNLLHRDFLMAQEGCRILRSDELLGK